MLRVALVLCVAVLALGRPPATKTGEEIEEFKRFLEDSRTELSYLAEAKNAFSMLCPDKVPNSVTSQRQWDDKGVHLDSRILANSKAKIWENSGKFEGDIVLSDRQIESIVGDFSGRNAYIRPNTKWPNNVVFYQFGSNEFNDAQKQAILNGIKQIEQNSCLRFRQRTNQRDYVLLTGKADGCYAQVGYASGSGAHTMNLARNTPGQGCLWHTVIIHEWLHVAGFFHMQSTHDRDNYVRINLENIQEGFAYAFERYGPNVVSNLNVPYDYNSIMHYGSHAFSKNGKPTITALRQFNGTMGQSQYVTNYDWLRLRRHYNCG